jgi:hypothetical protein
MIARNSGRRSRKRAGIPARASLISTVQSGCCGAMQNRLSAAVGAPTCGYHYEPHRYVGMDDHAIAAQLHQFVGVLLLRGRLETLLARREIGGLLCEFAKHHPKDRLLFEAFAARTVGLSYDEGRRHLQLWVYWLRCETTLQQLQDEARSHGRPFIVPGLRRLLTLAGVTGRRAAIARDVAPPEMPLPAGLPSDVVMLRAIVRRLLSQQRVLRARIVVLEGEVRYAADRVTHYRQEAANLRRQIRQMPNRVAQVHDELCAQALNVGVTSTKIGS